MKIIYNGSTEPYFNLAAEEYLLEHAEDSVFMLWCNSPAVVIGKNQNAFAEVNTEFTEANGIPVVRRLTGGGAVFHDPGNVNFTYITPAPAEPEIDFAPFTRPILTALAELGIPAVLNGRNDIEADGCKISGNAQCRRRRGDGSQWMMHHGTLLYDADITALADALCVNEDKLSSKGIKSVSSRVRNICEIGNVSLTVTGFVDYLLDFSERYYGTFATVFTGEEERAIAALAETKYSAWEWNFGNSPQFENTRSKRFSWGSITLGYTVDRGMITAVTVTGDFFGTEDVSVIESALAGCRFCRDAVSGVLARVSVNSAIAGATADDITDLLFGITD